ncbi:MAG: TonB-dependent receptor, partial [Pseudomonadota bacterium]
GTLIESLSPAEIETIGESLVNSPLSVIQRGTVGPDFNGSIDGGWSKDLDNGMTVALIGVAGYSSDWFTKRALRETQNGAIVGNDLDRNETALTSTVNGLVTTALSWEENTVSLTGLYIHSTRKESQIDEGFSFTAPGDGSIFTESNNALEQDLLMGQLAGEHTFGDFDIDWRGAYARSTRDDPYNQSFTREVRDGEVFFDPGRAVNRRDISWSELEDDNYSAGVDITWNLPFLSGPRTGAVSAGYEYVESERAFVNYGYFFRNPFTLSDEASGARVDFLYSPDNIGPSGFRLTDAVNPGGDAYTADLTVHGAYFEADLELIPTVRMTAGVRFEDGDQNVVNSDRFGDSTGFTPSRIQNEYWLPSAAITWNFVDNMQLRGSYSHTIGRPQFRELAGSQFSDPENDRLFRGNPFLIDSEFRNYDARYEYYLGSNQFITLAGFYKQIDNPIEEYTFQTSTGNFNSTFINAPEAELYGAEFEYRTRFGMSFTDWFDRRDWLFSVNYTFTESEVNASTGDEIITFSGTPDDAAFLDGAPLVGTPKHIVNAQFGWEDEDDQLTILLGWVDERIIQRGGLLGAAGQIPDVIEKPGVQLDVNFRHDVNVLGTDFTIGLSARNLLGTRHQEFQISDAVGRTDFNTYERGRDLSASLTAKF